MTVHSFNIFDRKGKILFTKAFSPSAIKHQQSFEHNGSAGPGNDVVSEQMKLVFGMIFSLKEILTSLSPENVDTPGLHSVKTKSSTIHNFETLNGLRFTIYTSNDVASSNPKSIASSIDAAPSARDALKHIYSNIYVEEVIRSPLYTGQGGNFDFRNSNFEKELDIYIKNLPWFR